MMRLVVGVVKTSWLAVGLFCTEIWQFNPMASKRGKSLLMLTSFTKLYQLVLTTPVGSYYIQNSSIVNLTLGKR